MPIALAVAIFFMTWWIVLFAVLPFGVRTQQEADDVIPGTAESAPAFPHLRRKMLITTLITAVLFSIFYLNYVSEFITLDDIPFLPRFEPVG